MTQEVPFNGAISATHLMFGLGEVFDLMEAGEWHRAEAHAGMLLVAGEQAAMDNWKWHHASKLSMVPDPPFHALIGVAGSSLSEPVAHLADANWIATAMAYAKDLSVFKEHGRSNVPQQHQPKGPPPTKSPPPVKDGVPPKGGRPGRRPAPAETPPAGVH